MIVNETLPHSFALELSKLASQQVKTANLYADARKRAGKAEADLKILLTSRLKELRGNKKNLGVEMAILILMEDDELAKKLYGEWVEQEALYKGYERILDATNSKLITEQALLKWQGVGEKYA